MLRRWARANPGACHAANKRWRDKDLPKERARTAAYKAAHPEETKARATAWRLANPDKDAAKTARRRASKLQATPAWANQFFIEEIYDLAQLRTRLTGFKWHVDHEVPLKHPLVCGLHNEFNLRVIPATENLKKHNTFVVG